MLIYYMILGWFVLGLIGSFCVCYTNWAKGEDLTFVEFLLGLMSSCTGVIIFLLGVSYLTTELEPSSNKWNFIILKGKNR